MSKHPYLVRHNATPGRFLALAFAFAVLAVALLLMLANTTGEGVHSELTPQTAPGGTAVPYVEEP